MKELSNIETFVGIDAHSKTCSIKALSKEGVAILVMNNVPTTSRDLRKSLKKLPAPICVMLEANAMGPLVTRFLSPVVERVIVCETRENRWISNSEEKSDPADADKLARLLRMGEFKPVHVPKQSRQELREIVQLYNKAVSDSVRAKNRLKAKFRQHGILVTGEALYSEGGRQLYLARIKRKTVLFMMEVLYQKLDAAVATQDKLAKQLNKLLQSTRAYKLLRTIPGTGPIIAAIFVGVIDDPWRFKNKRKLWKYAGLSVRSSWSGDASRVSKGGSRSGNRLLKYGVMMAALNAIRGDNSFAVHYREMQENGIKNAMAQRTIARKILGTALAIWKTGKKYREAK